MKSKLLTSFFCGLTLLFSGIYIATALGEVKELRINRITPEGSNVPASRQLVIEFNRPVVPLGKMQRSAAEIPINITPRVKCQWRWLNTSTLACNLDEQDAFTPATRYDITVKPGITAEDGATIHQAYSHFFITEQANIRSAWIDSWSKPGLPIIKFSTNLPVTAKSLEHHLLFTNDKNNKTLAKVDVIADLRNDDEDEDEDEEADDEDTSTPKPHRKIVKPHNGLDWIVAPKTELPLDSEFHLHLEPGLKSSSGSQPSSIERDILTSHSFPEFAFIGISCQTNDDKEVFITADHPQKPSDLCNQLAPIALVFNTPVSKLQIKNQVIFQPALPGSQAQDIWEITDQDSQTEEVSGEHAADAQYRVWLPWTKAAQAYQVSVKPRRLSSWEWLKSFFISQPLSNLQDDFGRKLATPFTIKFATGHRKPNYALAYHQAILEKNTDSEVPLYVNNLSRVNFHYRSVSPTSSRIDQLLTQTVPKVADIQFAIPLAIRPLLEQGSGAIYGSISTVPNVKKSEDDSHLFAEVSPFQVQAKIGHFNSLVWVTDFATGQPVSNAQVSIYTDKLTTLAPPQNILATALTDQQGVALLPGNDQLDPDLDFNQRWNDSDTRLFIRVDKEQNMALLPVSPDFIIDTWRVSDGKVSDTVKPLDGHLRAWGFTAQGIYRLADTIQYQFYVRNQNNQTLTPAPLAAYTLQVVDPTDKVVHEVKNIELSSFGAYSGEFSLPKNSPVGWYQFRLVVDFNDNEKNLSPATDDKASSNNHLRLTLNPMRVLVSDFTPAPFKVSNELNGDVFQSGQKLEITTSAKLHSGGPYTDAQARITVNLEALPFSSRHPLAENFIFSNNAETGTSKQLYQQLLPLDNKGEVSNNFTIPAQKNILYGKLTIESAVQDERGKYIATQSQADYIGSTRFVGLKPKDWVYNAQQPATINYVVVDEHGIPAAGSQVNISIDRQITTAAKIKDIGNTYTTHYSSQWQTETHCQGTSTKEPLPCNFTPQAAGDYRLTATVKDQQGRETSSTVTIWVVGKDYVLWNEQNDAYLQIIPEKTDYHVGETARFLVKNPFPGSLALVTVERYGILDSKVQTFDSSSPLVEIPIKADYLPGVYLSVTVFSPRVDKPLEKGQIDLGKPSFKMGYVSLAVKDAYKEIQVTANTDRPIYRPRETVTLKLHAQTRMPTASVEPIQLAVVVLDEAVFDLLTAGKAYYDPYQGFYTMSDLDLRNYSLLTRLIGRQKFEKKGANPGGDGGVDFGLRNVFKFISYWNPAVTTDANGDAQVQFNAPDNLTGWRILTLAVTPSDRMGLGATNFKVNRPTELRPIMPNQITEGDDFQAGFSVLNRTDKTRKLQVKISASGDVSDSHQSFSQTIELPPYKKSMVWMPIHANTLPYNREQSAGFIRFIASSGDSIDTDAIEISVPVAKTRSLETVANYGSTTDKQVLEKLAIPANIHADIGQINVNVAPTVITDVVGAFRYMKNYPYSCWEQKLTKGVMAGQFQQLHNYLGDFAWNASTTLPTTTLNEAANFQAPNGGMSYYVPEDSYSDPYLSAYTALGFNWLSHQGQTIPTAVEDKLHHYLLNYLRHDIAPDYYSEGMNASVRAVALAALAEHGKITKTDLERYQANLPQMSLFGQAHYLLAALTIPGAENLVIETTKSILNHGNETAGSFTFSESLDDGYQRILASPLRENCAILSAFSLLAATDNGKDLVKDIPFKLARSIIAARKNRDHWENTQENMFCMQALVNFSHSYESIMPKMLVSASFNRQPLGMAEFNQLSDSPVVFTQPIQGQDIGHQAEISINRQGEGRLYYSTQLSYAPLASSDQATNAGIEIHREYSVLRNGQWLLLKSPIKIKRGEIVRVDLYLSLPRARNFVVVNDPIPGGLEPVNRDLATASRVDAENTFHAATGSMWFKFNHWINYNTARWSFYHQELRSDAAQFYSDYLPAGNYHLSYSAQAIAGGRFTIMPVKAEEMYDPDVYGRGVSQVLVVE